MVGDNETEKRRSRNRISQRQFRERRHQHIKELEARVRILQMNSDKRSANLIEENRKLREALTLSTGFLARMNGILGELEGTLTQATASPICGGPDTPDSMKDGWQNPTDIVAGSGSESDIHPESTENDVSYEKTLHLDEQVTQLDDPMHNWGLIHAPDGIVNPISTLDEIQPPCLAMVSSEYQVVNLDKSQLNPSIVIPNFLNHSPQAQFYVNCASSGNPMEQTSLDIFGPSLRLVFEQGDAPLLHTLFVLLSSQFTIQRNGHLTFSEQIDRMLHTIRDYLKLVGDAARERLASSACLMAMILFTKHICPMPQALWFSSYCYPLVECILRSRLSYPALTSILPPVFQPSELQQTTSHSTIIDWICVPPLRDRLILHFNQTPLLDQVFVDLMEHAVVEVADISTILSGVRSGPGFLGVCNLYQTLSNTNVSIFTETICDEDGLELLNASLSGMLQAYKMALPQSFNICQKQCTEQGTWQPVPLVQLLTSRDLALKLYHYLKVHDSHEVWRIDPAFYDRYPKLKFDGFESTMAAGVSYRVTQDWIRLSTINMGM